MLTISGCGGRLCQYFRKSSVVQIFPEGFKMVKKATFRLADEAMFNVNAVSHFEVVGPLSFGLRRCFVSATNSEDFVPKGSSF